MRCAVCPRQAAHMHHVITRQALKRERRDPNDVRNLMPLCFRCHERHHTWAQRLKRDQVPAETWEFAQECGEWAVVRLEQDYPL